MCEYIDEPITGECWLAGKDDVAECPNCDAQISVEDLEEPDPEVGFLACPHCAAQLPWTALEEVPSPDWFHCALLIREHYPARRCFDKPAQRAVTLVVSASDERSGDITVQVTRSARGHLIVKVLNSWDRTYYPYPGTVIEGSYTVVRFGRDRT